MVLVLNPNSRIFFCNVTERRNLELQLQRSEKLEAIGTLAGSVAHDLSNILSGITSYPEVLILGLPKDSELRTPLQVIEKSGLKAAVNLRTVLHQEKNGAKWNRTGNNHCLELCC